MTTTTDAFRIQAIAPHDLDRIRAAGHDDFGNPLLPFGDEEGGSPLRCCLRPAEAGERLVLIAYRPFRRPGPYAEVGPVFVHADRCAGYTEPERYPTGYRSWNTMVFRPYHFDGRMAYPADEAACSHGLAGSRRGFRPLATAPTSATLLPRCAASSFRSRSSRRSPPLCRRPRTCARSAATSAS